MQQIVPVFRDRWRYWGKLALLLCTTIFQTTSYKILDWFKFVFDLTAIFIKRVRCFSIQWKISIHNSLFIFGWKMCEEIKAKLDAVYGDLSPSMTTVRYWFNKFKRGRLSIFEEKRPGRPADVFAAEIFKKVQDMILVKRRTKGREVAEAVGVRYGTALKILHDNLRMKKPSVRWVPRFLTVANKRIRLSTSKQCLDLFKQNLQEFLRRIVLVDETWIDYYTPEPNDNQNNGYIQTNLLRRWQRRTLL